MMARLDFELGIKGKIQQLEKSLFNMMIFDLKHVVTWPFLFQNDAKIVLSIR